MKWSYAKTTGERCIGNDSNGEGGNASTQVGNKTDYPKIIIAEGNRHGANTHVLGQLP